MSISGGFVTRQLNLTKNFLLPKMSAFQPRKMSGANAPKVFISRRIPEKARALIASQCDTVLWDKDDPPQRNEYLQRVNGINGLFCLLTDKIDSELLDAAGPSLKVVSTMSVGHDHIDSKECAKRNVVVGYTPGILTKATSELTVALLLATSRRLKEEAIHRKRPGRLRRGVVLQHDNATPHSANLTRQWLQRYGWEILPHPAHSPDLAPSDFHLFGPLKRHLGGMAFETEDDLISELRNWFDNLVDFFRVGINLLLSRWQKCINLHGDYVEK
ncbi:glyoxylate reductase/hydroxypyruvate reductase [Plakobranchus ocellatus]|uniref:Glyoxylate reductase/hydroxypyruvate reductase n=1 Tax=Plakobranchus ocellatus TaxID=259542 RepID=A0AAV3YGF0_9GAST|nr:glyoxylate reductase/hydroxypyruvate reductase [Plakobranchus ocellatus]